jgi:hypothetical protein
MLGSPISRGFLVMSVALIITVSSLACRPPTDSFIDLSIVPCNFRDAYIPKEKELAHDIDSDTQSVSSCIYPSPIV